jgi:hypothetical protein
VLSRRHDDRAGEAGTLDSLGFIALRAGLHAEAVAHHSLALALRRVQHRTTDAVRIQRRLDTLRRAAQFAQIQP